jgi:acetyltransferase-like isoleucine patch superfamily enzyme
MKFIDDILTRVLERHSRTLEERLTQELARGMGALDGSATLSPRARIEGAKANIRIGRKVRVGDNAKLACTDLESSISIGDASFIHDWALLETGPQGRITLGRNCSVNPFSVIYGHGGVTIGDYVRIATHTVIISASHIFEDADRPIALQGLTRKGIRIGNDVWIGCGCRILDGVTIGQGSVIGAGSVVTRSIAPMTVAVGVPARPIATRGKP